MQDNSSRVRKHITGNPETDARALGEKSPLIGRILWVAKVGKTDADEAKTLVWTQLYSFP